MTSHVTDWTSKMNSGSPEGVPRTTHRHFGFLSIDDEPHYSGSLGLITREAGYQVDTAEDGLQGLARARSESPDVVLLDLNLPKIPGLVVLEAMRRDHLDMPVVYVTGHGTGNAGFEARRLGAVEFLAKPFHGANLLGSRP